MRRIEGAAYQLGEQLHPVRDALLLTGATYQWVFLDEQVFCGFDEIFVFDHVPDLTYYPVPPYTSDWCLFWDGVPQTLLRYVSEVGASCYMSDGCGLNYLFLY